MTPSNRYDTSHLPDDQYEPGSDGKVLKNLLGITTREAMEIAETDALWTAQEQLLAEVEQDQAFTARDICAMHRLWLGRIYSWAGAYRQVNLSKGGFTFAMAHTLPALMATFESAQLKPLTPCRFSDRDSIAKALAEVHVELMLIHPFREGNGRLGRLLATLMGLQAGLPLLDFSEMAGLRKEEYFAAVRAGMNLDYQPMTRLFADIIELSS
jgi:cell filamentation protein